MKIFESGSSAPPTTTIEEIFSHLLDSPPTLIREKKPKSSGVSICGACGPVRNDITYLELEPMQLVYNYYNKMIRYPQ